MDEMIGIHISKVHLKSDKIDEINTVKDELAYAKKIGSKIVQFFVSPNIKQNEVEYYSIIKNLLSEYQLQSVIHISYSINCARNWDKYSWWIEQLILEIQLAEQIGSYAVVLHLGKCLKLTNKECLNNMYTSLIYVFSKIKDLNVKILIETSSGQGTEICYLIDDLLYFFKKIVSHPNTKLKDKFGICIDTCHIFVAGHDIRNKKYTGLLIKKINDEIGIEYIKLIHLNDSKNDYDSHVDRHENINKGYIGIDGLKYFVNFFKKLGVSIILETPYNGIESDMDLLKSF